MKHFPWIRPKNGILEKGHRALILYNISSFSLGPLRSAKYFLFGIATGPDDLFLKNMFM